MRIYKTLFVPFLYILFEPQVCSCSEYALRQNVTVDVLLLDVSIIIYKHVFGENNDIRDKCWFEHTDFVSA